MSDHDMRIGVPGEATPGSADDPAPAATGGDSTPAPPVDPSSMGGAEDTLLGSPKGGGESGDTGPGRYGGDADVAAGDLTSHSAGALLTESEQERIDRPYTTDASDVSRAAEAREAAHDIGGRWGVDEHGEVH